MLLPRIRTALASVGLAAILVPLGAQDSGAQDYSNRIGLSLEAGPYKLVGGNLDHTEIGSDVQVGLRLGWKRHFDFEAAVRSGFNWDDTKNFRNRSTTLGFDVLYSHLPENTWTPQAFAGIGTTWWTVYDFRGKGSPGLFETGRIGSGFKDDGHPSILQGNNFVFFVGLGAEYNLTTNLALRAGLRLDYLHDQHIDNTGASDSLGAGEDDDPTAIRARAAVDANQLKPAAWFGVAYFFGERGPMPEPVAPPPAPAAPDTAAEAAADTTAPAAPDTTAPAPAPPEAPAPAAPDTSQAAPPPSPAPSDSVQRRDTSMEEETPETGSAPPRPRAPDRSAASSSAATAAAVRRPRHAPRPRRRRLLAG
jgi:hypothetical protein